MSIDELAGRVVASITIEGDRSPRVELTPAASVLLATVVPFWMSTEQCRYWRHTHLTVDVVAGRGSGFSLEAPEGVRFLIRSRLMED